MKKSFSDPQACHSNILALQDALEIIGGKWTLRILQYLIQRENALTTFKKMEKDLNGISAKVLTTELKHLVLNKLVERESLPTRPPSVNYSITEYGKSLQPLIHDIVDWGLQHRNKIMDIS
jgi:DNA-binding HxlR family transcriptional regulator